MSPPGSVAIPRTPKQAATATLWLPREGCDPLTPAHGTAARTALQARRCSIRHYTLRQAPRLLRESSVGRRTGQQPPPRHLGISRCVRRRPLKGRACQAPACRNGRKRADCRLADFGSAVLPSRHLFSRSAGPGRSKVGLFLASVSILKGDPRSSPQWRGSLPHTNRLEV